MGEASREQPSDLEASELFSKYLPGLRAFLRLRGGQAFRRVESCSDLVQSVCREILEHRDRFRFGSEANFKQWLYTTALRKLASRQRYHFAAKRNVARNESAGAGSPAADSALLNHYATMTTPSQNAIAREELERIEKAFDRLPEDYRNALLMASVIGLSHADIAKELGRTEQATSQLVSRARARLIWFLGE